MGGRDLTGALLVGQKANSETCSPASFPEPGYRWDSEGILFSNSGLERLEICPALVPFSLSQFL